MSDFPLFPKQAGTRGSTRTLVDRRAGEILDGDLAKLTLIDESRVGQALAMKGAL